MYGVGTLPLVWKLKKPEERVQNWYADDSGVSGKLEKMRDWFDELCKMLGLRLFNCRSNIGDLRFDVGSG